MIVDENGQPLRAIHECWSDGEADVIISCLRAHGITSHANSEVPHNILPLAVNGLGKVQVLVAEEDVEQASFILRERVDFDEAGQEEA